MREAARDRRHRQAPSAIDTDTSATEANLTKTKDGFKDQAPSAVNVANEFGAGSPWTKWKSFAGHF